MKGERTRGKLSGKFAIVTGAAKGLGGAMAQLFAQEGAKVIAVDMMPLTYEAENVEFYKLNVTDGAACKELTEYAKEKYGKILGEEAARIFVKETEGDIFSLMDYWYKRRHALFITTSVK